LKKQTDKRRIKHLGANNNVNNNNTYVYSSDVSKKQKDRQRATQYVQ